MAPMHEGKVVKPEVFNALPEAMRRDVETKIAALEKELGQVLERLPRSDKKRRSQLSELNEDVAQTAIRDALYDLHASLSDIPEAAAYLEAAGHDMVRNVGLFLATGEEENAIVKQSVDTAHDPRFRRYMVNVMAANGEGASGGAPLVEEDNPTYGNLVGRVEHFAQMGTLVTDFLLIKPGALHKANGGYLLLDARRLLLSPFAWEALKRAIKAREVRIEQPMETAGLISTQTLDPEPIPLDIKVVLFGDRELYYLLAAHDPDFPGLFKVQADFDDTIKRSSENDNAYARVIASVVKEHGLKPVDAAGVARVIDEGARLADDREKLSIELGRISDIVREADYWSSQAKRKITSRQDVSRAIDEQIQRADRLRDRAQETINRGIVLLDTEGSRVGQINGLSVLQLGSFSFGRPSRITARVRLGAGRVVDIEREAKLGGALHTKGVMILWGFLAGRYALDVPLALAATLGVRAILRRCRRRQCFLCRTVCTALGARRSAHQAVAGRDGLRQPAGRGAGHRRRQREDRGLLRPLPRPGTERGAGRADTEVQRAAPDAARGRGGGGEERTVRHLRRRHHRRRHRDPDRRQGRRARSGRSLRGRHRQPAGGRQAEDVCRARTRLCQGGR